MSRVPVVPADTAARQARATDPAASAWVSANAGSGKTYVLVERVVRLLLAGTDPGRILCLTYTTAAAANMSQRVFDRLAAFATASDETLAAVLARIEGRPIEPRTLKAARRLFARALETPGGLKIQTIHAFCASLLAQFPLEANVAGRFSVIDDQLAAELVEAGTAALLRRIAEDPADEDGHALDVLIPHLTDLRFRGAIADVLERREAFRAWVRERGGLDGALAALRAGLDLGPDDTPETVGADILGGCLFAPAELTALADALAAGGKTANERAEDIRRFRTPGSDATRRAAWTRFLFDSKGEPRAFARAMTKAIAERFAASSATYEAEQARVAALADREVAARAFTATAALMRLASHVLDHVEAEKQRRGLLDYADQVARAADLLSRADAAAWVRYKLDRGVEHILVDEAQDTSPLQWKVVTSLAEEFFSGAGGSREDRTIFAVGDEKQSIYGFQGAAPEEFARMRALFSKAAADALGAFHDVRLHLSFRSTLDVLGAVDRVFADPAAHEGLTSPPEPTVHEAIRGAEPGYVELWPPEAAERVEQPDDWRAPLDRMAPASPPKVVADRIASTIAAMIAGGDRLADGRRIAAGDVIVLVRKRGPFVEALSRALKAAGVPVAGADQIVLSDHIAVMDLVALGNVLTLPDDDLSLAALLKSPLFDFDEEALFALAHGRTGRLYDALAGGDAAAQAAHARLESWRGRVDRERPFELYSGILGREGGRRRFLARLGSEAEEALDAFLTSTLAYEQVEAPTLEGFLGWFTASPFKVKREVETAPREVRIMTVHGAKGLEAPVVFLVDNGEPPVNARHDPSLVDIPLDASGASAPALLWAPTSALRPKAFKARVAEDRRKQEAEYRRLLYVGMTRAADRLYVCGWSREAGPNAKSWQALVHAGLASTAEARTEADGRTVLRWTDPRRTAAAPSGGTDMPDTILTAPEPGPDAPLPDWVNRPAPPAPPPPRRVAPSAALALEEAAAPEDEAPEISGLAALGDGTALLRGRLVHRLIELLASRSPGERPETAARFLAREAGALAPAMRDALAAEVLAVVADPAFAALFAPGGRAEVHVSGRLTALSGEPIVVAGRIDRLIEDESGLAIVDFKTDRRVPDDLAAVPAAYVAQLSLYRRVLAPLFPGRAVRGALLFTAAPRLIEIAPADLDTIAGRLVRPD